MIKLTALLLPALLACPALGASAPDDEPLAPLLTPARTRPLLDAPGDGSAWALGETYKLGLSAEGARFAPLLGGRVEGPRWLRLGAPVLSVDGRIVPTTAGAAQVEGQRLWIDRGPLEERFDCRAETVEHSFWIPSKAALPRGAELLLQLPVGGDLTPAGRRDGQCFEVRTSADSVLSTVTYGDWLVRDSRGRELRGETGFEAGCLSIRVPAEFWSEATFPLLIDPILSVFSVDSNSFANESDGDVSYDLSNDRWLVVYQDSGNDNDNDILSRRYAGDGTFLEEVAVDIDGENDSSPRVANNNKHNAFLVVWARQQDFFNTDRIQGRRRLAGSTTQGSVFNISNGANEIRPDVGGTSDLLSDDWAVIWEEATLPLPFVIRRLKLAAVGQDGAVASQPDLYSEGGSQGAPFSLHATISSNAGPQRNWLVGFAPQLAPTHFELRAVAIAAANFATSNEALLVQAMGTQPEASAAGNGRDFLLAFTDSGNGRSVLAFPLNLQGSLSAGTMVDLSSILEGSLENTPQDQPSLSGDGFRYLLAYRQGASGLGNFDIRVASLVAAQDGPGSVKIALGDAPSTAQVTAEADQQPALASMGDGGGPTGQGFCAWTRVATSTNLNLNGFLFETVSQPGVQTVQTGCGLLLQEPVLSLSGLLQPGSILELELSLGLGGTAGLGLIQIGAPLNLPLCPGQATCALGVGQVFLSLAGTEASIAIPPKVGFVGATFAIQGAAIGVTSGVSCGAPLFPVPFRVSDTKIVTIG